MKVKICGITNLEDALDAIDAGADALGNQSRNKYHTHKEYGSLNILVP